MTFLGRILQVEDRENYYKTAVGVETGYSTDVYTIRINHEKIDRRPQVDEQVLFTGIEGRTGDRSEFILDSIKFIEFSSCLECGFPLATEACIIRHDKEARKLDGEWTIYHKIVKNGNIKLFFQRDRLVFGTVAQPKDYATLKWLYSRFRDLEEGDKVKVRGWRYITRTSISFIEKLDS